eukprot:COSAG02_NODE_20357_length_835_cov_1.470109_2_plen_174_part_01
MKVSGYLGWSEFVVSGSNVLNADVKQTQLQRASHDCLSPPPREWGAKTPPEKPRCTDQKVRYSIASTSLIQAAQVKAERRYLPRRVATVHHFVLKAVIKEKHFSFFPSPCSRLFADSKDSTSYCSMASRATACRHNQAEMELQLPIGRALAENGSRICFDAGSGRGSRALHGVL